MAPTITTMAAATTALSVAYALSTADRNCNRLAAATATTVHIVKVMTISATQSKKIVPYQWKPLFR